MSKTRMSVVVGIIMIGIALIMFPLVLTGTSATLQDEDATEVATVDTALNIYEGNVTLSPPPYNDEFTNIESVTSSLGGDNETLQSFTASNNRVLIGNLTGNTTRTLTVTYTSERTEGFTGLKDIVQIAPVIVFLSLMLGGGGMIWKGTRK